MSTNYNLTICWQCLRCWAVNDLFALILPTLLTNGCFSTLFLIPLGKNSTAVTRNYACLMSPNKDETVRRLSRMLFLLVVFWSSLFIILVLANPWFVSSRSTLEQKFDLFFLLKYKAANSHKLLVTEILCSIFKQIIIKT